MESRIKSRSDSRSSNNSSSTVDDSIQHLYVSGNDAGAIGGRALGTFIAANSQLRTFEAGGCSLTDEGCCAILRALSDHNTTIRIGLDSNQLGDGIAPTLASALQSQANIQRLDLSFNSIGAPGIAIIAPAMTHYHVMTSLYISNNQFGNEGAGHLAGALKSMSQLQELDVSFNLIRSDGIIAIVSALWADPLAKNYDNFSRNAAHPGLPSSSTYAAPTHGRHGSITLLSMSGNAISLRAAERIAHYLKDNSTIRSIHLDHMRLDQPGERQIATAIATNQRISLTQFSGFQLGAALRHLGSPPEIGDFSNEKVLLYLANTWNTHLQQQQQPPQKQQQEQQQQQQQQQRQQQQQQKQQQQEEEQQQQPKKGGGIQHALGKYQQPNSSSSSSGSGSRSSNCSISSSTGIITLTAGKTDSTANSVSSACASANANTAIHGAKSANKLAGAQSAVNLATTKRLRDSHPSMLTSLHLNRLSLDDLKSSTLDASGNPHAQTWPDSNSSATNAFPQDSQVQVQAQAQALVEESTSPSSTTYNLSVLSSPRHEVAGRKYVATTTTATAAAAAAAAAAGAHDTQFGMLLGEKVASPSVSSLISDAAKLVVSEAPSSRSALVELNVHPLPDVQTMEMRTVLDNLVQRLFQVPKYAYSQAQVAVPTGTGTGSGEKDRKVPSENANDPLSKGRVQIPKRPLSFFATQQQQELQAAQGSQLPFECEEPTTVFTLPPTSTSAGAALTGSTRASSRANSSSRPAHHANHNVNGEPSAALMAATPATATNLPSSVSPGPGGSRAGAARETDGDGAGTLRRGRSIVIPLPLLQVLHRLGWFPFTSSTLVALTQFYMEPVRRRHQETATKKVKAASTLSNGSDRHTLSIATQTPPDHQYADTTATLVRGTFFEPPTTQAQAQAQADSEVVMTVATAGNTDSTIATATDATAAAAAAAAAANDRIELDPPRIAAYPRLRLLLGLFVANGEDSLQLLFLRQLLLLESAAREKLFTELPCCRDLTLDSASIEEIIMHLCHES